MIIVLLSLFTMIPYLGKHVQVSPYSFYHHCLLDAQGHQKLMVHGLARYCPSPWVTH